jgi:hypothetical protein
MKSQFEIVKGLLADPTVNWLKVDYFKRAKFDMAAWFRLQTGETVETGGIKKSHFMSGRMSGSSSPSLLLTMSRETGSRNDDDAYDFRSMILAALCVGGGIEQNVSELQVNRNFTKGFEAVSLDGLPVFPQFADDAAEKEWAVLFSELCRHRATKELLDKQMNAIKKKLDKKGLIEQEGHHFSFEEPKGTSDAIVDKDNNRIPTVASNVPYLSLEIEPAPEVTVDKYSANEIVKLYLKIKELAGKITSMTAELRPYELGILERFEGDRKGTFSVGGITVKVSEGHAKGGYQHSEDTANKVKSGEYKIVQVPKDRGKWICNPIPAKGTVEMSQPATVNA